MSHYDVTDLDEDEVAQELGYVIDGLSDAEQLEVFQMFKVRIFYGGWGIIFFPARALYLLKTGYVHLYGLYWSSHGLPCLRLRIVGSGKATLRRGSDPAKGEATL